jgi:hypothetical protein
MLSEMFRKVGDDRKAQMYHDKYIEWKRAIQEVRTFIVIVYFIFRYLIFILLGLGAVE